MSKEYMGFSHEQRQAITNLYQHDFELLKSIIGDLPGDSQALFSDTDSVFNHHFIDYLVSLSGGVIFEEIFLMRNSLFGIESVLNETIEDIYVDLTCMTKSKQHYLTLPIMLFLKNYIAFTYSNREKWLYDAYRSTLVDFEAAVEHEDLPLYGVIHKINTKLNADFPDHPTNVEQKYLNKYLSDLAYTFSTTNKDIVVDRKDSGKPQDDEKDMPDEISSSTYNNTMEGVRESSIFDGYEMADIVEKIKNHHSSPYDHILEIWWRTHRIEGVSSNRNLGVMLNTTINVLKDLFTPEQMDYINNNLDVNYVFGSLFGTMVNEGGNISAFTESQIRIYTLIDALVDISRHSGQSIHEQTLTIYKALDLESEISEMVDFIDKHMDQINSYLEDPLSNYPNMIN